MYGQEFTSHSPDRGEGDVRRRSLGRELDDEPDAAPRLVSVTRFVRHPQARIQRPR